MLECKTFDFKIDNQKETLRDENGVAIGSFDMVGSTFRMDSDGDELFPGAFLDSLAEHRRRDRKVIMNFMHARNEIIGGFPIETMREDKTGLLGTGHLNLEVRQGKETFALMRQKVIREMSIAFRVRDFKFNDEGREHLDLPDFMRPRDIFKVDLMAISPVDRGANAETSITNLKRANDIRSLNDIRNISQFIHKDLGLSIKETNTLISKIKEGDTPEDELRDAGSRVVILKSIHEMLNGFKTDLKINDLRQTLKVYRS